MTVVAIAISATRNFLEVQTVAGWGMTIGATYPFSATPWTKVREQMEAMSRVHPQFQHMTDIVDSVIAAGMMDRLAAMTSMHDLLVVSTPISEPPYDLIHVAAPGSLRNPKTGEVIIEHEAASGYNDKIARPVSEAVSLFWRFVIEKYGIRPPD
jgi:hypothetical protein